MKNFKQMSDKEIAALDFEQMSIEELEVLDAELEARETQALMAIDPEQLTEEQQLKLIKLLEAKGKDYMDHADELEGYANHVGEVEKLTQKIRRK